VRDAAGRERLFDGARIRQINAYCVYSWAALGVARKSADGPASGLNKPFNEGATDDAGRPDNESVIGHRTTQP
jgi:hypothetical protein